MTPSRPSRALTGVVFAVCVPVLSACILMRPRNAEAGREVVPPPALTREHRVIGGAVTFRTPDGWTVRETDGEPRRVDAIGPESRFRVLYRRGEIGLDSLHVTCMEERLTGPMDAAPEVEYDHDFLSFTIGSRHALESAFTVTYDTEVAGHTEWRQRNVSVVGGGESICLVSYVPEKTWKKSEAARKLAEAVMTSVVFARQ